VSFQKFQPTQKNLVKKLMQTNYFKNLCAFKY